MPGPGRDYVGGVAFKLPFGTIYAPNITPDKETGIGTWSDADFVRAMHRGVSKSGHMLYPAFPYAAYALMRTDDVLAIKAFLFSLPPVHAPTPKNAVKFPFNQTYLLRAWRLLFVPGRKFKPDPSQSPQWNRGNYLVEALGHCGECHTPRNLLYGLDKSRKFAGATTQGWKAYNISSDRKAGLGNWSDAQIVDYLASGHAPGRGSAGGTMAEAVEHSLRHLTSQDIQAIVAYLRSVPPQQAGARAVIATDPPAAKASSAYASAPQENPKLALGLHIFQDACASCHGFNGRGLQTKDADLLGSHSVNDPQGTNLMAAVLNGTSLTTSLGSADMPSFGQAYSNTEIAALSNYVIRHFGGKTAAITPSDVANARKSQ
ncbi:cytochrome c [Methylovirgula sp. HY1]|uniref:cytochrome c n=1 Tax=Methylovirgula sp. HY1 TaxID=2822761 RepID=UPI001C5AF46D|nr:cytochrome c [Methylovirgula sp. HY1]QXX76716.1 Fructose dehydrogenase cytochrome subunit [Methylovirgula sp. HY1]